ncbi:MAG: DUF3329 domain-containing protein, partial [bacterium]
MQQGFRSEIRLIILIAVFLGLIGAAIDDFVAVTLAGLIGYTLWTLKRLFVLYKWIKSDGSEPAPYLVGVVGSIADNAYRLRRKVDSAKDDNRRLLKRLTGMANSLAEGVVILNHADEIIWWNRT